MSNKKTKDVLISEKKNKTDKEDLKRNNNSNIDNKTNKSTEEENKQKRIKELISRIEEESKKIEKMKTKNNKKQSMFNKSNVFKRYNAVGIDIDTLENVTSISLAELAGIRTLCDNSAHVRSIIEFLLSYISGPGINIGLEGLYHKIDLEKVMPGLIQNELIPFVNEFIKCQLLWGFCVVVDVDSEEQIGLKIPVVARFGSWNLKFGFKDNKKIWKVYESKGILSTSEYKEARVYELFPPRENGLLTSPLYTVRREIQNLTALWNNTMTASFSLSNPEIVVETIPEPRGKTNDSITDPTETYFSDYVLDPDSNRYKKDRDIISRDRFEIAVEEHNMTTVGEMINTTNARSIYRGLSSYDNVSAKEINRRNLSLKNALVLPEGKKIVNNSTAPSILNNTDELIRNITITICTTLGVSQSFFVKSGKMHAANTEMELINMNSSIQNIQKKISYLLDKVMEHSWDDVLSEIDFATFDNVYSETVEDEHLGEILDEDDLTVIYIAQQLLYTSIKDSITVIVGFNRIPYTTTSRIIELYNLGIINHDTLSNYMAKLTGIKQSDISSKKERKEMMEEKKQEQDNNNYNNEDDNNDNNNNNKSTFIEKESNISKNTNKNLENITENKEDNIKNKATKRIENKNNT